MSKRDVLENGDVNAPSRLLAHSLLAALAIVIGAGTFGYAQPAHANLPISMTCQERGYTHPVDSGTNGGATTLLMSTSATSNRYCAYVLKSEHLQHSYHRVSLDVLINTNPIAATEKTVSTYSPTYEFTAAKGQIVVALGSISDLSNHPSKAVSTAATRAK